MKKQILLFVFLLGLLIACDDNKKTEQSTHADKTSIKEELPEPIKCTSDLGLLKIDANSGETVGKKTEKTELLNMLNKDCDIIEINYTLKFENPAYENIDKKIVYNKREKSLKDIYTKNNVIEAYNNVTDKAIISVLSKKKGLYALESEGAKYEFNNNEMTIKAVGEKPKQSELDGSVKIVEDFIKDNAKDAGSVKFLEWSKVTDFGDYWVVRCKYKGKNDLGVYVTEDTWFYIQNSTIVKTKPIL